MTDTLGTWTDEVTGYECVILVGPLGALNGYVRVPEDHPLYGIGYSQSACGHDGCYEHTPEGVVDVHGGITYAGSMRQLPEGHWFGFDTAHAGDFVPGLERYTKPHPGDVLRDEGYVTAECTKLARQLHGWKSEKHA